MKLLSVSRESQSVLLVHPITLLPLAGVSVADQGAVVAAWGVPLPVTQELWRNVDPTIVYDAIRTLYVLPFWREVIVADVSLTPGAG